MRKQILIAGFACLSLIAVAQSNQSSGQNSTDTKKIVAPRDAATGQASGKKEVSGGRDATSGQASGKISNDGADQAPALRESPTKASTGLRESPSKASLGKTSVDASTGLRESPTRQTTKTAVADTNGDGHAARESSAASVSEIVVTKPSDKRVATGDVNGDGKADAARGPRQTTSLDGSLNTSHSNIKNAKDAATGQASGKRQYAPVKFQKELEPANPKQ